VFGYLDFIFECFVIDKTFSHYIQCCSVCWRRICIIATLKKIFNKSSRHIGKATFLHIIIVLKSCEQDPAIARAWPISQTTYTTESDSIGGKKLNFLTILRLSDYWFIKMWLKWQTSISNQINNGKEIRNRSITFWSKISFLSDDVPNYLGTYFYGPVRFVANVAFKLDNYVHLFPFYIFTHDLITK
jgi:hypothetical protein